MIKLSGSTITRTLQFLKNRLPSMVPVSHNSYWDGTKLKLTSEITTPLGCVQVLEICILSATQCQNSIKPENRGRKHKSR